MVLREPRPWDEWEPFWGCGDYPRCRGALGVDRMGEPLEDPGARALAAIWKEDRGMVDAARDRPDWPEDWEAQAVALLRDFRELELQLELLRSDREARRREILGPDVLAALAAVEAELEAEYGEKVKWAESGLQQKEARLKALVAELGRTVKGEGIQAVYSAGRVKVNVEALQGYAAAHPEVRAFMTVGRPSVSIRRDKNWEPRSGSVPAAEAAEGEF
jgi:hypothetical protein